jgi:3-oxoacyl-[acyl-carrier protein] reductase
MITLQNKTALVTGASRGIGRATAAALAEAGAHVLVHYGRSTQEAESLVAEIRTKGGHADAISADLLAFRPSRVEPRATETEDDCR